jgi:16S rRNA (cytosine967-C5)-methyltransferase
LLPTAARLATERTYGTLRWLGFYDALIEVAANRNTQNIAAAVLDVLRLGTYQLLNTRTSTHAAVDESVHLSQHIGATAASGFVNGVL